jgi:N-alpha-acetyltransferase 38, NatC auxiliary subunit
MDNVSAVKYLDSLLNRTFRAHTSDGRMFLGEFKCTDNVISGQDISLDWQD